MDKTCSTCIWCRRDELQDMICVNEGSEYCSDYVEEIHRCEEWEGTEWQK